MSKFNPTGSLVGDITTNLPGLIATAPNSIVRLGISLASTEYSYTLPLGTVRFRVKNDGDRILRISYIGGDIALGSYYTLAPRGHVTEMNLAPTSTHTIYVESLGTSQLLEIISWT
jgi:hypothetical protein